MQASLFDLPAPRYARVLNSGKRVRVRPSPQGLWHVVAWTDDLAWVAPYVPEPPGSIYHDPAPARVSIVAQGWEL